MRLSRSAVRSIGWLPVRIDLVMSGARKARAKMRLISLAEMLSSSAIASTEDALPDERS